MSERFDPTNILDNPDRVHGDFAEDEGLEGYHILIDERYVDQEWTISEIAERAIRLQMMLKGRWDIDPVQATTALVSILEPVL